MNDRMAVGWKTDPPFCRFLQQEVAAVQRVDVVSISLPDILVTEKGKGSPRPPTRAALVFPI